MTDFIHEHPKDTPQTPKEPAYVPPKTEAERQKKVYVYVGVLFAVAFLLIGWSSLMSHRGNEQLLSELKESTSTLQSVIDESESLEARIRELEVANATLSTEHESLTAALAEAGEHAANALCAMDYLRGIEREYGAKRYDAARELIRAFEDNGLAQYLPAEPLHTDPDGSDAPSPAETYQSIVESLFPDGLPAAP